MGDYIDEVFEADCPKYVDFAEPQVLEDNADEWFNFDHENGIPVVFSSPEKMDTSSNHNNSKMQIESASDNEEYHECDPAPLTETDLAAPSPALPPQKPPGHGNDSPVKPSSLERTAVTSGSQSNSTTESTSEEDEECLEHDRAPVSMAELAAPSPAVPLQKPLGHGSDASVKSNSSEKMTATSGSHSNSTVESTSSEYEECEHDPTPVTIADLAAPSPTVPLQKPPAAVDLQRSIVQNNLDLINVSGESTPKAVKPAGEDIRPSNIVTSWNHRKDIKSSSSETHHKPTATAKSTHTTKAKTVTPRRSGSKFVRSNSVRRSTRSVGGATSSQQSVRSRSLNRRSAAPAEPPSKQTTAAAPRTNFVRSNSLRRSTRSVGGATPSKTSVRARSLDRRSADTNGATKQTTEAVQSKRKRFSSPAPSGHRKSTRMSPRLQHQKPKLTMPHTPVCLKRNIAKPGQSKFKSSEEIEMERIEKIKQEAKKQLQISKKSYRQAMEAVSYHPTRSVAEPTRPMEFKFETDSRLKNHSMETRQDREMRDFASALRKHDPSPKKNRGPTVPKPFHFSGNRKRQHEDADPSGKARKFRPMALQINEFHSRTPDRFRTKATKDANKGPNPVKAVHSKPALTCPKTPALETRSRKRPNTAISAAEKEEMEVQEMRSYTFRARPIDQRVMSNINLGVTRPQHKSPTKAVGFDLESEKRFREREANKKPQEEERHEFHARPLPLKMLEGPTGIAPVKPLPITCPKSPAFALKNRVRVTRSNTSHVEEEETRVVHARPVPHVGVPFIPNLNHKVTESKPFSFDDRDQKTRSKKEAKIQEVIREEEQLANQFKAQPLPYFEDPKLPQKRVKPVTKQEPFKLSNEERGAQQAEQWSKKMEEELNEQRQQASSFKAKPADVLYEAPFVPMKSNKPLTDISEFDLNTDRRAVERHDYEERKHAREASLRVANEERQRREEEEERQAIERLRLEMVHKSNPIRRFKTVEVLPSNRPLTEPESPHFATDSRLRSQPRL